MLPRVCFPQAAGHDIGDFGNSTSFTDLTRSLVRHALLLSLALGPAPAYLSLTCERVCWNECGHHPVLPSLASGLIAFRFAVALFCGSSRLTRLLLPPREAQTAPSPRCVRAACLTQVCAPLVHCWRTVFSPFLLGFVSFRHFVVSYRSPPCVRLSFSCVSCAHCCERTAGSTARRRRDSCCRRDLGELRRLLPHCR